MDIPAGNDKIGQTVVIKGFENVALTLYGLFCDIPVVNPEQEKLKTPRKSFSIWLLSPHLSSPRKTRSVKCYFDSLLPFPVFHFS